MFLGFVVCGLWWVVGFYYFTVFGVLVRCSGFDVCWCSRFVSLFTMHLCWVLCFVCVMVLVFVCLRGIGFLIYAGFYCFTFSGLLFWGCGFGFLFWCLWFSLFELLVSVFTLVCYSFANLYGFGCL